MLARPWCFGVFATILLLTFEGIVAAQQLPSRLSSTGQQSFAVTSDGRLLGWGDDSQGLLGLGRQPFVLSPQQFLGATGYKTIAGGGSHSVGLKTNGDLYAWGWNAHGQIGDGTTIDRYAPTFIGSGYQTIAAGDAFTVALKTNGDLYAWGENYFNELGDGTNIDRSSPTFIGSGFQAVAAGIDHAVALKTNGDLYAWGYNHDGELGDGTNISRSVPTFIGNGYVAVAAGAFHTVALKTNGDLYAWGTNDYGQLGDATQTNRSIPTFIGTGYQTIAAGGQHTVALKVNGDLYAWGYNSNIYAGGDVGDGTTIDRHAPVFIGSGYRAIAAGENHTVALRTNGDLYAWGGNRYGQVGDGTFEINRLVPVFIGSGYQVIAAGGFHTIAVRTNGDLYAWGLNGSGQLGDGIPAIRLVPTLIGRGYQAVAGSVALKTNGDLYAWGYNNLGQVGDGTHTDRYAPVLIGSGYRAIAGTFAIKTNGDLYGWGLNLYGELGDGTTNNVRLVPTFIGSGFQAVAPGGAHTVGLKANGDLYAWGSNYYGQLGDGTTTDHVVPTLIGSGYKAIAAGGNHTVALKTNGDLYAWGNNDSNQLGNGAIGSPLPPESCLGPGGINPINIINFIHGCTGPPPGSSVPILIGRGYQAIAAEQDLTMAIKVNGDLYGWGSGPIGDGGFGTPVPSFVGSGYQAIAAGYDHALASKADGTVWAWGENFVGQIGDGTLAKRDKPVVVLSEGGAGSIQTNDWFLSLTPGVAATIPSDKIPVFLLVATGNLSSSIISLTANTQFRPQDVGKAIRVFALTPASLAKLTDGRKADACVLTQPTPDGMTQVAAGNLAPIGNVTGAAHQEVTLFNHITASQAAGSCMCFGTGTGTEATSPENNRCVATVPAQSSSDTCTCPDGSTATVATPSTNIPGELSGLWWNANESGWGIHFTQRGSNVFAAWYTYDTSGNPKWYVSTCSKSDSAGGVIGSGGAAGVTGSCSGTVYEVNGPTFFAPPFNSSLVNPVTAGSLQLTFQDAGNASMTYGGISSLSRTVAITRQPLSAGTPPAIDYTDIWWGGARESGWGMAITQQSSTIFLAWYVYDNSAKPTWYVATCTLSGTTCAGSLLRTTGPAFGPTFNSSHVQSFTAGTISVNFTDGNNATLNYTVNGVSGSKTITRQLF